MVHDLRKCGAQRRAAVLGSLVGDVDVGSVGYKCEMRGEAWRKLVGGVRSKDNEHRQVMAAFLACYVALMPQKRKPKETRRRGEETTREQKEKEAGNYLRRQRRHADSDNRQ